MIMQKDESMGIIFKIFGFMLNALIIMGAVIVVLALGGLTSIAFHYTMEFLSQIGR